MSRRRKAEQREIVPDPRFNNNDMAKFIQRVMYDGKKSIARSIFYNALDTFCKKAKVENPVEAFEKVLENAMPLVEVKSRRIGGATYQVPVEIPFTRKRSLGMKWLITHARNKAGRSMTDGLAQEFLDCFNNTGATVKKRDDTHRMAEANKAFAHYKW